MENAKQKIDISIKYPKGIAIAEFKKNLENKNINKEKLQKYFTDLDRDGEAVVVSSSDEDKLNKATQVFKQLGFDVERNVHFELIVDETPKKQEVPMVACPVCDTSKKVDKPGEEKPCPTCHFVHYPNESVILIMKKRIEWEESLKLKEQKQPEAPPQEQNKYKETKEKLEAQLRKEIRADLMQKMQPDDEQEVGLWAKLAKPSIFISITVAIAIIFFVLGYCVRMFQV